MHAILSPRFQSGLDVTLCALTWHKTKWNTTPRWALYTVGIVFPRFGMIRIPIRHTLGLDEERNQCDFLSDWWMFCAIIRILAKVLYLKSKKIAVYGYNRATLLFGLLSYPFFSTKKLISQFFHNFSEIMSLSIFVIPKIK